MPMPFFDDPRAESRTPTLISHMMALTQAVAEGKITAQELEAISQETAASLANKEQALVNDNFDARTPLDESLKKLYSLLQNAPEIPIKNPTPLIEGLKHFDSEHGGYLPLTPLATKNHQTLALSLNDFATFYRMFIQHMTYTKDRGELGDHYDLNFDLLAARTNWLQWQGTRPNHIRFDPSQNEHPALFEKFMANQLKPDEWLSDVDIRRELTVLGLEKQVHVIPFKADDIGLVLHFEREKHQQDDPKAPYVIPLIVNLGEDGHSRIDSRGVHWTRMLVTVDPRNIPPTITVDYKDELFLHDSSQREITKTIREALAYRTELGGYSPGEHLKIYQAFPDCDAPTITVEGSGEQKDGFTCGYRALRGTVQDLIQKGVVRREDNEEYANLLDCDDSTSLRNCIYRSSLGKQPISAETKSTLSQVLPSTGFKEARQPNQFVVSPTLVEGQILALSKPTAKKESKKGKLNPEQLEKLVEQNEKKIALGQIEAIKAIATSKEARLELNLQAIVAAVGAKETDPKLIWQVVFEQIGKNSDLKTLTLTGTDQIDTPVLYEKIDALPRRIKLSSAEPLLVKYLDIINARNTLLDNRKVQVKEGEDPWESLFENMLFTPADLSTGTRFAWIGNGTEQEANAIAALGVTGFSKLLHYVATHEDRFADANFAFKEFDMRQADTAPLISDQGLDFLKAFKEHLQSPDPFIPFKQFYFTLPNLATLNQENLFDEIASILAAMKPPALEKLEINTGSLKDLSDKTVDSLIKLVTDKNYPTILSFTASKEAIDPLLQAKLEELENAALLNRRQGLSPTTSPSTPAVKAKEPVVLGKIGKAILHTEGLAGLNTEVQIQEQEQQQQQVQQQIQTALNDEELPEEDEIQAEAFPPYAGAEDLLTRKTIHQLESFIEQRHPHLTPEQCWDLITGPHADAFQYGIKKMTTLAAKMLIDNLQDVQYGLHPDNLPRGFSLQQDKAGDVVLAYTSVNPAINPNESPLTIHFNKPMAPNDWAGSALQFMTLEEAKSLYQTVIAPMKKPRPSLETCITQFFFLRQEEITVEHKNINKNIPLSDAQRAQILNGFIAGMSNREQASLIQKQIADLFGKTLPSSNMKALSEVLYEQGPQGLSALLEDLTQIKTIKGEKFFASFKTCFIDPSQNLNELTTAKAHDSIQKLLTLSSAQTSWWLSLTEQHSKNRLYHCESDQDDFTVVQASGKRWANLAELTEGFLYFCGQLEEVSPGLKLTEYCPLTDIADMRVGLDRLLTTILPNALNADEQFYQGLQGLSLDPLGPFYASRYEGYKLVTPDMLLNLEESYSESPQVARRITKNKTLATKGFCFRSNRDHFAGNFSDDCVVGDKEKMKSLFLRYIATFNHRAPLSEYSKAADELLKVAHSEQYPFIQENLLIIVAAFATGKRGKHFTQKDIQDLIQWAYQASPNDLQYKKIVNVLFAWRALKTEAIRPTIAEIIQLSKLALTPDAPIDFINQVQYTIHRYAGENNKEAAKNAETYLDALMILTKNKQTFGAPTMVDIIYGLEGLKTDFTNINEVESEFKLPSQIRATIAKLLAVCNAKDIDKATALKTARKLCTEIETCLKTHGPQTTSDLLELLSHIDVEQSEDLPSLNELVLLISDIAANPKPDYQTLEQTVKNALPANCQIKLEEVIAASVEPAGNLQMIITKYMGEIRDELGRYKSQIDAQLGQGFFDKLATPEGTKSLLDRLQNIADMSGLFGGVVQDKIKGVMLKVYEGVTQDGLKRIGLKTDSTQDNLAKIIHHKIAHPVKKETDFAQFCQSFAAELQSLTLFLGDLQTIHKIWPTNFNTLVETLDKAPNLPAYPLSLLAHMTQAFVTNFDRNAPFANDLLQQFLAFETVNPEIIAGLKGIVDEVFDEDKAGFLDQSEKKLLCELALRYCKTTDDPQTASGYVKKIAAFQASDGDLFAARLKLLSGFKKIEDDSVKALDEAFAVLNTLPNPEIRAQTLGFFTEDPLRQKEFLPVIKELNNMSNRDAYASLVLAIALKAAQANSNSYNDGVLPQVITNLGQLDIPILQQLDALYRSPRHPDLAALNTLLSQSSLDTKALQNLEIEYDRDYWRVQGKEKDRDFSTAKLATYLNHLQDMNYERPLLLSQRQELQRWFLYMNAIGYERGIPTQPWMAEGTPEAEVYKPVKDMSHEEIQRLLAYYRAQLKDPNLSKEMGLKIRLETIALLREAMYRGTGKFPRATQILYLLAALQNGQDFIAQIPTGQGKSLTAALAAAMENIEGKTVDICTSTLFLAHEGLKENEQFFKYLDLKAKLVHASSAKEEYEDGAIHYSSMSELALYRSKMQLAGKTFPPNAVLIADEVDFSTLDDSTRYRYASLLDPVTDPYKSPYTWIYEALVNFVDTQNAPKNDAEFLTLAKSWLRNSAKSKEEKTQLKDLEAQAKVYDKRLETWLVAAGKTQQLVTMQDVRFRVVEFEHKKYGTVSKACILTGGRPNLQAEFSDAVQQFLHVRLRQKDCKKIDAREMPDFLVEPEKTYITTLNSRILFNIYQRRLGMSGTAGSREEIKEQYAKYGFRFVDIPPFIESQRQDLEPILTNPKYSTNPEAENRDHINRIVKEVLSHRKNKKSASFGPILIHCADKIQGEAICKALQEAINKNPRKYQIGNEGIQQFYSSEKSTPEARNAEEQGIKEKAGKNGMITISTVFGRGTDIKPEHTNGLYTIDTFVDTAPHSSEDLKRAKQQKSGRSGRAGGKGLTRLIVRRSEFLDVYTPKKMGDISETVESLDDAISQLNQVRNQGRVVERDLRESFDAVKDAIYQEFFKYIQVINSTDVNVPKKAIRDQLTKQWSLVLGRIDDHWESLQHNPTLKDAPVEQLLEALAKFACSEWNELAQDNGVLRTGLTEWAEYNKLSSTQLPEVKPLNSQTLVATIRTSKPLLERFYVKSSQYDQVDPTVSEATVYSDFMASSPSPVIKKKVDEARTEAIEAYVSKIAESLSTKAYQKLVIGKFNILAKDASANNVKQIMGALFYLRYKAYRHGNPLAYSHFSQECRNFIKQITWSQKDELIEAVTQAQQTHFNALTNHRGKQEKKKGKYLSILMAEGRKLLPEKASVWKTTVFASWWNGSGHKAGLKAQATKWLSAYQNNWWSRGYVSSDRKAVALALRNNLRQVDAPTAILEHIANARTELLRNDKAHSRSLKSSVQGRLYQYLNELELKVFAAMTPQELDAYTDRMFKNVDGVLQHALDLGINLKELKEMYPAVHKSKKAFAEEQKYQALCVFFKNVSLMEKPKGFKSDNWSAFQFYCQQTKFQMVRYFDQSDKNSSFNERRSVQVYQAASDAAAAHIQEMLDWDIEAELELGTSSTLSYRDKTILVKVTEPSLLTKRGHSPLFLMDSHRELLQSLEARIVENSSHQTQVQFEAITLEPNNHYQERFKLSVDMIIDGVRAKIDYHINRHTGEMYCDDSGLKNLDKPHQEPVLGQFQLPAKLGESQTKLQQTRRLGEQLNNTTQQFKQELPKPKNEKEDKQDSTSKDPNIP